MQQVLQVLKVKKHRQFEHVSLTIMPELTENKNPLNLIARCMQFHLGLLILKISKISPQEIVTISQQNEHSPYLVTLAYCELVGF